MNTIPLFSFSFRHGVNSFFSVQRKDHGARGKFTLYTGGLGWFGAFFLIFHELENEGCFFDSHDTTTSWRMGWDDSTHASAQGSEEQKGGTGVGLGKAVAKASVGPPRGVMVVTRETFGREGVGGGGGCRILYLHSYTHNSTCCLGGDFSVDLVEMVMRMGWMMMRSRFP